LFFLHVRNNSFVCTIRALLIREIRLNHLSASDVHCSCIVRLVWPGRNNSETILKRNRVDVKMSLMCAHCNTLIRTMQIMCKFYRGAKTVFPARSMSWNFLILFWLSGMLQVIDCKTMYCEKVENGINNVYYIVLIWVFLISSNINSL
jgi:hypothetical protein